MYAWRFLTAILLAFFVMQPVSAATLYIDPGQKTLGRGDAEIFKVRLDTDEAAGECVNAVSGVVAFTGPISPIDISTGPSILSIWIEPPTLSEDGRKVSFAGGIPNGYCGRVKNDPSLTNVLFEIIARADTTEGEQEIATLSFTNETTAYLNNGAGDRAPLQLLPSTLTIAANSNQLVTDPWTERVLADTQPPQEFSIAIEKDRRAFAQDYYIVFNTTDKETGIDRYEVMEEPLAQAGLFLWGRADAPWRTAVSPYVLRDQSLNSIIRVKAIDKAGNEYVANLVPDEKLRTMSHLQILTYVLWAGLVLVLRVLVLFFLRFQQKSKRGSETDAAYGHPVEPTVESCDEMKKFNTNTHTHDPHK